SKRLAEGGLLIDRNKPIKFEFNGRKLSGFDGDTLASALLSNDQVLVGRSFKYHRPRGIVSSGSEEPNALINLGEKEKFEPNQRATTTELFDGLKATSQNHWPSLNFDIGVINNYLARFLPAGFYYKMFIHPRPFWKYIYEPFIRKSAGLGRAPSQKDNSKYEHFYAFYDLVIVGGGISGLNAALAAAESGLKILIMEQTSQWGGRCLVDFPSINDETSLEYVSRLLSKLRKFKNVTMRSRMMGAGVYDHGYLLGYERLNDHLANDEGPRHRLWRIRAKQIVTATGAIERPLSFPGNDVPGIMLASAVRDYAVNFGIAAGNKTAVYTNNDDAYRTAIILNQVGIEVPVIIDARVNGGGELAERARALGIRVENGKAISKVFGKKRVVAIMICNHKNSDKDNEKIECDSIAMSGGWSPVVHLYSHCGGKLKWDEKLALFRPESSAKPTSHDGLPFVTAVGSANGFLLIQEVLKDAREGCLNVTQAAGGKVVKKKISKEILQERENALQAIWIAPQDADIKKRSKIWLDFQNDVKVNDVELAAREGFESVEHAKRYTTLGMATDQGKLSNINGLAILASSLDKEIPKVGTTTFRPPYTPISLGSIGGSARDGLFQPVRKTPMHHWHENNEAYMEPVGQWRRPFCYPQAGETHAKAVEREINQTRSSLGLLDASTLGKLLVTGPDAGKFLDMLYTNMMSTLKVGKCRYGLMCSENGFLIDDGVVARIDEQTWLCHTTTGGADSIHGHMEEWLQTEWWDWKVYVANVTEQYAQVGVVGPNSRKLLEKIGGFDVSKEALGFMEWKEGKLGKYDARVFRISFSGELSFEIAVPARQGMEFWNELMQAGEEFQVMPYGTEALHVMRAEKGFIMIGDETDGTVIPQDLNLNWAISKKKDDFLGKRAQERSFMVSANRWKLVGLETIDGSVLPDGAYATADGFNPNGQKSTQGRVTSSYFSPTLKRGIAMGLVLNGPLRNGEVLDFPKIDGTVVRAKITTPVFYDPNGEKQNV
ncbi:MAG: sarcosine oxidase subunit alpha family protein, partial [Paracoccaceae bacterium]